MTIHEVYKMAKNIPEYLKDHNKYTWMGFHKVIEVKYLDVNDIIKHKTPLNNFIIEHGAALLFPNIINEHVVDISVRALNSKHILNFKVQNFPYNIGQLNNFKYGDTLFVVEGIADLAGLKLIDPTIPIVALKTNDISKGSYDIYKNITNKMVLILDNDKAGQMQITKMRLKLKELGIQTLTINQFATLKDTGDIIDLIMSYQKSKDNSILTLLNNINLYYKSQIKLIKNY
jgi:DNA primase